MKLGVRNIFSLGVSLLLISSGNAASEVGRRTWSGSADIHLEQGKLLYQSGDYTGALNKFMAVLKQDPHNSTARQYLRLVVDAIKKDPAKAGGRPGVPAATSSSVGPAQLQKRALLTVDLQAVPGIILRGQDGLAGVEIPAGMLFAQDGAGLLDESVPVLTRVASWLNTFGDQPILIRIEPEGSPLVLERYSAIYAFLAQEKKLAMDRFIGADAATAAKAKEENRAGEARVVIETIGSQAMNVEAMAAALPPQKSAWIEFSISGVPAEFNPMDGEDVVLDLAAMSRTPLAGWEWKIIPKNGESAVAGASGDGNLLRRVRWDGRHAQSGSFVVAGAYRARLNAKLIDGSSKVSEISLRVKGTKAPAAPRPAAAAKPKPASEPTTVQPAVTTSTEPRVAAPAQTPASEPSEATPQETPEPEDDVHAIWKQPVQFETNQAQILPAMNGALERIAKTLEVYPLQKVRVVGFAAKSEARPAELAKRRAEAVRSALIKEYRMDAKRVISGGVKVSADPDAAKVEMSITN